MSEMKVNISSIVSSLIVSFILGGVMLYSTMNNLNTRIQALEQRQIPREVVEREFKHINDKLDRLMNDLTDHIRNTTESEK
jgi:archaellum component FlaF (FlaF/FlaG flagellin family)